MTCTGIEVDDVVGEEAVGGYPDRVIVTGQIIGHTGAESVDVWLALENGNSTSRVEAVFSRDSNGVPTENWEATLSELYDPDDEDKLTLVNCLENDFFVHAECTHESQLITSTVRHYDFLWCCPWIVEFQVTNSDGTVIEGEDDIYSNLERGNYTIEVSDPSEITTGQTHLSYKWYVDNRQRESQTNRSFNYPLREGSHAIKAEVTQDGCSTKSDDIILKLKPLDCPRDLHINDLSISAKCDDGKKLLHWKQKLKMQLMGCASNGSSETTAQCSR